MFFLETAILLFVGTFLLTYLTIPKIIRVARFKKLMDNPNQRSSHTTKTPTLGGVAFFYTIIFALFFINERGLFNEAIYIIPGLTILFITGLKDDLVVLSPRIKLVVQIIAVSFILANDSFIIHSLNGFLNINEIPYYLYLTIGAFVMIIIINSYNLIDGIDGLASITGIVITTMFIAIFYLTQEYFFALLGVTMNSILMAFFGFNISSNKKIFMGNTGSLIVGFVISILTIKFFSLGSEAYTSLPFHLENAPLIAISILIVPLFDTGRVFIIRVANKKSPFSPDRNHIHHILVDFWGLSHKQASFIIGFFNLIFVVLFVVLCNITKNLWLISILVLIVIALGYVFFRYSYNYRVIKKKIILQGKIDKILGVKKSEKLKNKKKKFKPKG